MYIIMYSRQPKHRYWCVFQGMLMLCLFYVLVSCSTLPDDFQQVEEGEQELSDMAGGSDSLVAPVFVPFPYLPVGSLSVLKELRCT